MARRSRVGDPVKVRRVRRDPGGGRRSRVLELLRGLWTATPTPLRHLLRWLLDVLAAAVRWLGRAVGGAAPPPRRVVRVGVVAAA